MKRLTWAGTGLLAAGLAAGFPAGSWAGEPTAPAPPNPTFEKMKSLAGEWDGTFLSGDKQGPVEVRYAVTSAGSTVMETLFAGTEHEMVTMYHLDGRDLVLTHYCTAGNQPRMRSKKGLEEGMLAFKFDGGTNLSPGKDMHMHEAVLTFVDADHIRASWTSWKDGKPAGVASFDLHRKKG